MFTLAKERLYWWPIKPDVPSSTKSGNWEQHSFEMQFKAIAQDRVDEIERQLKDLPPDEQFKRKHEIILEVAVDWRQVVDEDKQPVPFSTDMLDNAMRAESWFRLAVYRDWTASLFKTEARKGN